MEYLTNFSSGMFFMSSGTSMYSSENLKNKEFFNSVVFGLYFGRRFYFGRVFLLFVL